MSFSHRQIAVCLAVSALSLALSLQFAIAKKNKQVSSATEMDEHKRALHALNRLTFGPRPGDVDRVAGARSRQMDRSTIASGQN